MKNIKKRALSIFLAMIFLILPLQIAAVNAEEIETNETLVNVVVTDSDGLTIVAQVPETYVEEYESMLENPEFRQEQIEEAQRSMIQTRLPEGKIMYQKEMDIDDIEREYKRVKGTSVITDSYLYGIDFVVTTFYTLFGGFWGAAASFLVSAISIVSFKPEAWWSESFIMILTGEINCVRVTHIENTKPTYPAAYLIYERL
ncbi:MAG TPA: hypothetical protein IAD22_03305 [Candidatus Limousia pullorum]|uniref:Uncharacterized protein n=1 Tax=Candidatus Limousia pullorum TaxID=2840860 RepID=A0A9D1LY56_9FIRM|nr:hypothetical protein [Candidatus Limousia pullorum]